jgi:hypothetical protein
MQTKYSVLKYQELILLSSVKRDVLTSEKARREILLNAARN